MTYTLITGASGGIGRELAIVAAKSCKNLILVARSRDKLESLASELDTKTVIINLDLAQPGSAKKLFDAVSQKNLTVDELINNAGVGDYGNFDESDLVRQQQMLQLNITTLVELTHLFLPSIVANRGKIMNLSSVAGFLPGPRMSVYFASKHFVLAFSEALHEELRGQGVTVTCLCPGPTKTSFGNTANVSDQHATANPRTSAESVAKYGYKAMQRGKAIAVPGFGYRVSVFIATRLTPRSVLRRLLSKMQK